MQNVVWICMYCSNQQTEKQFEGTNFLKNHVDDIICTVRGDTDK